MEDPTQETLLHTLLPLAVLQRIDELHARGGATQRDINRIQTYGNDICELGTDVLYKSTVKGASAQRFNQLADILAVMAFYPGGVTAFGEHYEVTPTEK